jgi:hypothetical protein
MGGRDYLDDLEEKRTTKEEKEGTFAPVKAS